MNIYRQTNKQTIVDASLVGRHRSNLVTLALMLFMILISGLNAKAKEYPFTSGVNTVTSLPASAQVVDNQHDVPPRTGSIYNNPAWTTSFYNRKVDNRIILNIDRSNLNLIASAITFDIDLTIETDKLIGNVFVTQPPILKTIQLKYDPGQTAKEVDRVVITLEDVIWSKVTINNVAVTGSGLTYPNAQLPVIQLENRIEINRIEAMTKNALDHNLMSISSDKPNVNAKDQEIRLTWPSKPGAESYEVEFAFIQSPENRNPNLPPLSAIYIDFRHSATRIRVTDGTSLDIPIFLPEGYLVYRVRALSEKLTQSSRKIATLWSLPDQSQVSLGQTSGKTSLKVQNYDVSRNWNRSTTYAEETKYDILLEWSDGLLRTRSQLSMDHENDLPVVASSIYDHLGRPAVSVMPSPVFDQRGYDFREKLNQNPSGQNYSYTDFDLNYNLGSTVSHEILVNKMSDLSGSNYYYSDQFQTYLQASSYSENVKRRHSFLPDADGYAFSQQEFTNDPEVRLSRSGSVGKTHQLTAYDHNSTLSEGKQTVVWEGLPTQEELDVLFAAEVGPYSNYKKIMTQDVNGQVSLTYIDLFGRTIATALAGDDDNTPSLEPIGHIAGVDGYDVFWNNTVSNQKEKVINHTFLVTQKDSWKFNYEFQPLQMSAACDTNFCYSCEYEMTISLIDQWGNEQIPSGPITATVGTIDDSADCQKPIRFKAQPAPIALELGLGEYTLVKTLRLTRNGLEQNREYYLKQSGCVKTFTEFLSEELSQMAIECEISCEHCDYEIGELNSTRDSIRNWCLQNSIDTNSHTDYIAVKEELSDLIEVCNEICEEKSPCDILYQNMLADVTLGGQYMKYFTLDEYGNVDKTIGDAGYNQKSILSDQWRTCSGADRNWRVPFNHNTSANLYYDPDGTESLIPVFNNYPDIVSGATHVVIDGQKFVRPHELKSVLDFVKFWKSSWAESLIYIHPEYCYYPKCQAIETTYEYDAKLVATEDPREAQKKGYYNPLGLGLGTLGTINSQTIDYTTYEISASVERDPILNLPYYASHGTDFQTSLTAFEYLLPDANGDCQTHTNTIWEVYEQYRLDNGLTTNMTEQDTCMEEVFWPILRGMYLSQKRAWLKDYYTNSCDQTSICDLEIPQSLLGVPRWPGAQDISSLDDIEQGWGSIMNLCNAEDYENLINDQITSSCERNCEDNVNMWIEWLSDCSKISNLTEGDFNAFKADLQNLCMSGCDIDNPYGSITRSLKNSTNTTTYPFGNLHDVFKKHLGNDWFEEGICDDLLIQFPGVYGHDYLATDDPDANDCICDTIKWSSPHACPDLVVHSILDSCGCSYPHDLAMAKASQRHVFPAEKCQNCIVCKDLNDPVYQFYERYDSAAIKLAAGDPLYQDMLTTWVNRSFGFNLTYYEYEVFARNCIDPGYDSTVGQLWNTLSRKLLVSYFDESYPFDLKNDDIYLNGGKPEKIRYAAETPVLKVPSLSPFIKAGFARKKVTTEWATTNERFVIPGEQTSEVSQSQDVESIKCQCERIMKIGHLLDSGHSGGLPAEDLYDSLFNTSWPSSWNFNNMRQICCKLWKGIPVNDPTPCEPDDYLPGMKFPPESNLHIQQQLDVNPPADLTRLDESTCDPEIEFETETGFLDTCGCKELKKIREDYDSYLAGTPPQTPPITLEAFALREKGFAIDNIQSLLEACEKMWGTGERKDNSGNTVNGWTSTSNWNNISGSNLEEYAEDMDWLLNKSLLCNPKEPCVDNIPCDRLTFHFMKAVREAYNIDLIVNGQNLGNISSHLPGVLYLAPLDQMGDIYDIMDASKTGSGTINDARLALLEEIERLLNLEFSKCNPNAGYSLSFYLNKLRGCHKKDPCVEKLPCETIGQAFKDFLVNNPRPDDPGYAQPNLRQLAGDLGELYYQYHPYNGTITQAVQDMLDWFALLEDFFNARFNKCYNGTTQSKKSLESFIQFTGPCSSGVTLDPKPKPCPKCYTVDMEYLDAFRAFLDQITRKDQPNYLYATDWNFTGIGAFDINSFYNNPTLYDNGFSNHLEYVLKEVKVPELVVTIEDQNGYEMAFNLTFPSAAKKWNFGEIVEFLDVKPLEVHGCRPPDMFKLIAVYRMPKKYWGSKANCPNVTIGSEDYCYDTIGLTGRFQTIDIGVEVPCLNCARLCNKPFFRPIVDPEPCFEEDIEVAMTNALTRYDDYLKRRIELFDSMYVNVCMNSDSLKETMRVRYNDRTLHHMLYYYDRSGSLVKTVPPAGVDVDNASLSNIDRLLLANDRIAKTAAYRSGNLATRPLTYHDLATQYRYNSLGKIVSQETPDGGESNMWYDELGRPILSQNEDQAVDNKFAYTVYDELGRTVESGIVDPQNPPSGGMTSEFAATNSSVTNMLDVSGNPSYKSEVLRSYFDEANASQPIYDAFADLGGQQNLRNWISYSTYEQVNDNNDATYDHGVFYSYDAMGNLSRYVQDLPTLAPLERNLFSIDYTFDLLSGNVLKTIYQKNQADQFVHRLVYDRNNQLVEVQTSRDDYSWESESRYEYYFHGPLARQELGELNVQGMDYAYTLQGWVKGVNGAVLNSTEDIGQDGMQIPTNPNRWVARDAFAYDLSYFNEDYTPINGGAYGPDKTGSDVASAYDALYNGNIAMMTTSIPMENDYINGSLKADVMGNVYRYDQLNRIFKHRVFQNINSAQDAWLNTSATGEALYYEDFQYDGNGNITRLRRNGHLTPSVEMDSLIYHYDKRGKSATVSSPGGSVTLNWEGMHSNKLYHVNDQPLLTSRYTNDVDDPGTSFTSTPSQINTDNTYGYDVLGNLTRDESSAISEIVWTASGKIKEIKRGANDAQPDLEFGYDVFNNRMYKVVKPKDASNNNTLLDESHWQIEYYIRDGEGKVLATYTRAYPSNGSHYTDQLKINEFTIYGSSRIGVQHIDTVLVEREFTATLDDSRLTSRDYSAYPINVLFVVDTVVHYTERGLKTYELSNHLGNVLVTIQDRKQGVDYTSNGTIDYFIPYVIKAQDYYAFGSLMDERGFEAGSYATSTYKYGFQGQEADDEIHGSGNSLTAQFWQYDSRLGRRWNVDPVVKHDQSGYSCYANNPIWIIDPSGADSVLLDGVWKWKIEENDWFSKISIWTGIPTEDLMAWNKEYEAKNLPIGEYLNLNDPKPTYSLGELGQVNVIHFEPFSRGLDFYGHKSPINGYFTGIVLDTKLADDVGYVNWVQTIKTNYPHNEYKLLNYNRGTPVLRELEYTDPPVPNDPPHFYSGYDRKNKVPVYGDNLEIGYRSFSDQPGRPKHQDGPVYWVAELSLVRQVGDSYVPILSLTYGFDLQSDGTGKARMLQKIETTSQYHTNVINSIPVPKK
ncbi:MAG: hypothetical protein JJ975_00545 [Bacteroidia bacterium]|nr:hypothetical protein [Bacteroidia bacterium]